jgi:hypothetical protein
VGEPTADPIAWDVMIAFANGTISSMPEAETKLAAHLGNRFSFPQWKTAFDTIFQFEGDESAATDAIKALKEQAVTHHTSRQQVHAPPSTRLSLPELDEAENQLMQAVDDLCVRKHIRGERPTLEDLLNPEEEKEVGDSMYRYPGGDADIIAEVKRGEAAQAGDPDNSGCSDDESDDDRLGGPAVTTQQGITLCRDVESLCLQNADADGVDINLLQSQLRKLRSHLHRVEFESHTQVTLDRFFIPTSSTSTA